MSIQENDPREKRLLALERRLIALDNEYRQLYRQAVYIWQTIWSNNFNALAQLNTCTATFSGTLEDCTNSIWTFKTIYIKDHGTNVVIGMVTTDGFGNFSGSITITDPSQVVDFDVETPGYNVVVETLNCGSNTLGTLAPVYSVPANPPTINSLSNLGPYCGDPGLITVNLSGISDGNGGVYNPLTVTAVSSNTAQIPTPTVTYTSPNTTGTISFTPTPGLVNCSAPTTITVKVTDSANPRCGGLVNKTTSFTVTVRQPVTPTLNPITNPGAVPTGSPNQTVSLSGISPGACNTSGSLSVTATSAAPGVAGIVSVSYAGGFATTGTVTYSIGTSGTALITVTVTDGNMANCHSSNTFSRTFTVTVS